MDRFAEDTALVQRLVAFAGTTPAAVAKRAGVAVSTVNRPFNGTANNRLGRAVLEKLRRAFPEFPGWEDERVGDQRLPFRHAIADSDPDLVELDEIDLRYGLGATYLDNPVVAEKRTFSRAWLRQFTHAPPELLFWTIGDGDSMEPTIRSGEVILIDRSQLTPRMGEGIWALAMGEIGLIKRLHFAGRGRIELLSDNKLIPPISIADDELHVVGRVVAVVRRL